MRSGKEVTSLSLAGKSLHFTDEKCAVFRNWERNSNCCRLYLRKAQSVSDGPSCYGHKIRLNNFFQKNCKPSLIMKLRNKKLFKTFIVSCVAVTWLSGFYPERIVHCHLGRRKEWKNKLNFSHQEPIGSWSHKITSFVIESLKFSENLRSYYSWY